jgi:hypothetical protein
MVKKATDTEEGKVPTVEDVLRDRHETRSKAPTMESRNITALETIADELTAIRMYLQGSKG